MKIRIELEVYLHCDSSSQSEMSLSCQNEILQFKESLVSLKPYTYFIMFCEKDVNKTKWEQSSTLLRGGPFQITKLFKMNMTSYKIFVLKNSYAIKLYRGDFEDCATKLFQKSQ